MTKFLDGPAQGQTLMLKRMVMFLRVTECQGKFDALDQPLDTPLPNEKLFAYVLSKHVGNCHICRSGGRGGFYPIAEYKIVSSQPSDETMRDYQKWIDWCRAQPQPNLEPNGTSQPS